ncbi:MAG: hypothetical protein HC869_24665 [Rhodospirillales bacterium]|nr:hypothetical protein [Rhodospirillales bacterium]
MQNPADGTVSLLPPPSEYINPLQEFQRQHQELFDDADCLWAQAEHVPWLCRRLMDYVSTDLYWVTRERASPIVFDAFAAGLLSYRAVRQVEPGQIPGTVSLDSYRAFVEAILDHAAARLSSIMLLDGQHVWSPAASTASMTKRPPVHARCHALPIDLRVKKTFAAARQTGGHLSVRLKKNQPELFERILAMTEATTPIDEVLTRDLARNRREDRKTEVFDISDTVAGAEGATCLQCVIRVGRNTFIKNAKTGQRCLSVRANSRQGKRRPPSEVIGVSRTAITMSETPPSSRTKAASDPISASAQGSEAMPSISYGRTVSNMSKTPFGKAPSTLTEHSNSKDCNQR